jgi:hypothetical protein
MDEQWGIFDLDPNPDFRQSQVIPVLSGDVVYRFFINLVIIACPASEILGYVSF